MFLTRLTQCIYYVLKPQISTEYVSDEWGLPQLSAWRRASDIHDPFYLALLAEVQRRQQYGKLDDMPFEGLPGSGNLQGQERTSSLVQIGGRIGDRSQIEATYELIR